MNLSVLRIFNMKRPKLCKPYDPVDYLESKEDFALYLQSCFEDDPGDGSLIKSALLDIAKAKGMAEVAKILSALGIELRPIVAPQIKTA